MLSKKFSRNRENEADRLGLYMMVEAGYHPDFMISLYRKSKQESCEESKVAAFFSDHPRWDTREKHTLEVYDKAMAYFEKRWKDGQQSPGGPPPPVGTIGEVRGTLQGGQVVLRIPVSLRNVAGQTIAVAALLPRTAKGTAAPWETRRGVRQDLVADSPILERLNESLQ